MDHRIFDVFTVSETWLDETIESTLLAIDGYDLFRSDRSRLGPAGVKKGGGLAIYVHTDCLSDSSKYANLNKCNEHIETQIVSQKEEGQRFCDCKCI